MSERYILRGVLFRFVTRANIGREGVWKSGKIVNVFFFLIVIKLRPAPPGHRGPGIQGPVRSKPNNTEVHR